MLFRHIIFLLAFLLASAHAQLKVQYRDENITDPKWLHARILVSNATSLPQSNLRAEFWLRVPAGRVPQAMLWDGPGVDYQLSPVSGDLWKVSMVFRTPLAAGGTTNFGNGALIGLRLDDWSNWTKSGSPSWISTSTWMDDPAIPLYDSLGNLLWGAPPITVPTPPVYDTVTISSGLNGRADPSGQILVKDGDPLTVNFIPNAKYRVKSVVLDGVAQGNPSSWKFDAVGSNHSLSVSFELNSLLQYQVTVDVGPHGKSNVTGAVLVPSGNPLNLRFQPDAGYTVSQVRLDGQPVAVATSLDIASVQAAHTVQVLFAMANRFSIRVSAGGGGRTDPIGDQLVALNGYQSISVLPDPGYQISNVVVDGVSKGAIPYVAFEQVQAGHVVVANFRRIVSTGAQLEMRHRQERDNDSVWSKTRLVLSNLSTNAFGPYTYYYYFRVEPSQVPMLASWSMPQARGELQALGLGNWRLAITSNSPLGAGASENWGNGNFFGLQVGTNPPLGWDLLNDWSFDNNDGTLRSDRKVPVYDGAGNLVFGTEPDLRSFATNLVSNVQALYHDQGGDTNYLRPRILIRNLGDISFSDFKVVFIFQTEDGKIPIADDWYLPHPSVSVQAVGNQTYRVVWDYTGVTVGPHSDWPSQPGTIMGLHYGDWSAWNRSNDYSHIASPTGNLVVDPKILIYDRDGNLVWGQEPIDTTGPHAPTVVQDPSSQTVNEGGSATFEVQVVGDGPISYQWRRNGIDIPGANAAQYVSDPLTMGDDQDVYACAISNAVGKVVSRDALLTVRPSSGPPTISSCPDSVLLVPQGGFGKAAVVPAQPNRTTCSWIRLSDGQKVSSDCQLLVRHPGIDRTSETYRALLRDVWSNDTIWACSTRAVYQSMAQTSMILSLSGQVATAKDGALPRDTIVDMVVRMYDLLSGGTPVYLEQHLVSAGKGIPVNGGRFVLEVGRGLSRTDLAETVLAHRSLFLEVGVGDSSLAEIFLPRVPLNAVPWELGRTVQGSGEPGARWSSLPVGSLYVDWNTRRTWRKNARGWKPLDL